MKNITLQALSSHLNSLLRAEEFSDHCPNGLQVEGRASIELIATAVSASLETIKEAVQQNVDALVVHHGMFWKGDQYPVCGVKKEKLQLLLNSDISLLAYHLPLDAHRIYGNNWKVANDLGWQHLRPCAFIDAEPIGVYGEFKPMPREKFAELLVDYYGHEAKIAAGGNPTVKSACLVSGGAYKMISEAVKMQADCFITGNFDEPAWHDAHELHINFYAMGHSATERVGPIALKQHLEDHFKIKCRFIDLVNPF